ncbi:MAG: ribosome-associated heat shock protein Hsp15 [Vicingaceae bacterium]|jgi:ribosome-associated heat shock protein Hsp15
MRIDKYIWTIRLFKTRSLASKECAANKVLINDELVKASKEAKVGDVISIRVNPIWKSFKLLDFPKSRVAAKLVSDYVVEITDEIDLETLALAQEVQRQMRHQGFSGRPTKRNRRKLDDLEF